MSEYWDRIQEIFHSAKSLEGDARDLFLVKTCGADEALLSEVRSLLESGGEFSSTVVGSAHSASVHGEMIGKVIAQYTIRRVIGSGGMGVVYEAIQKAPRRTVALKMLKRGVASRSALRRFEYEAQTLGRLHHDGIAQIFEAGTIDEGSGPQPWFAMEYLAGAKSLGQFCNDKKLGTRERLALFTKVCAAVQHGHTKGIIHRDLKPSNILVSSAGVPKIIDFGVARSTDSDMALTTLQTDVGQLIGTLQYMSPEQCAADPNDLDTRSDVYALGVILFELLCGKPPYDIRKAALHEAARIIREEEPTKLSSYDRTLRGDLEVIALKALEKDRDRRYQSTLEFQQDISRYLDGEPIAARRPSAWYYMRRFAKRYRATAAALVATFGILVVAVVAFSVLWVKAEDATKAAVHATLEAESATKRANEQTEIANTAKNDADIARADAVQLAKELEESLAKSDQTKEMVVQKAINLSDVRALAVSIFAGANIPALAGHIQWEVGNLPTKGELTAVDRISRGKKLLESAKYKDLEAIDKALFRFVLVHQALEEIKFERLGADDVLIGELAEVAELICEVDPHTSDEIDRAISWMHGRLLQQLLAGTIAVAEAVDDLDIVEKCLTRYLVVAVELEPPSPLEIEDRLGTDAPPALVRNFRMLPLVASMLKPIKPTGDTKILEHIFDAIGFAELSSDDRQGLDLLYAVARNAHRQRSLVFDLLAQNVLGFDLGQDPPWKVGDVQRQRLAALDLKFQAMCIGSMIEVARDEDQLALSTGLLSTALMMAGEIEKEWFEAGSDSSTSEEDASAIYMLRFMGLMAMGNKHASTKIKGRCAELMWGVHPFLLKDKGVDSKWMVMLFMSAGSEASELDDPACAFFFAAASHLCGEMASFAELEEDREAWLEASDVIAELIWTFKDFSVNRENSPANFAELLKREWANDSLKRWMFLVALQHAQDPRAIPALLSIIEGAERTGVRGLKLLKPLVVREACKALSRYPRDDVVEALIGTLSSPDWGIRREAVRALEHLTGQTEGALGLERAAWLEWYERARQTDQVFLGMTEPAPPELTPDDRILTVLERVIGTWNGDDVRGEVILQMLDSCDAAGLDSIIDSFVPLLVKRMDEIPAEDVRWFSLRLGSFFFWAERWLDAEAAYRRGVEALPEPNAEESMGEPTAARFTRCARYTAEYAKCLVELEKTGEAEKWYSKSISYWETVHRTHQDLHDYVAHCRAISALAQINLDRKDFSNAELLYSRCHDVAERAKDKEDLWALYGLKMSAWTLLKAEQYAKAIPRYQELIELRRTVVGDGDELLLQDLRDFAYLYEMLGDAVREIEIWTEIHEIAKGIEGDEKRKRSWMHTRLERLIEIYDDLGKPEEVNKYRDMLRASKAA